MRRSKPTRADRWRLVARAFAAAGCVLALAACGSSGNAGNGGSTKFSAGVRFSSCMRSHGVPNFPDPGPGGGIQLDSSSGIDPQSPAFQSAQRTCAKLLPGGGPPRGPVSAARKLQLLRLAQCMRAHGLTTFPDPTSTPPSAGHGSPGRGIGLAFGSPGAFIAVPQSLIQSPAFSQAAAVCGFPGAGKLPRSAGGSGRTTTNG